MVTAPAYEFHHVALSVTDTNAAVAFYGLFGFREAATLTVEDEALTIKHLLLGDRTVLSFFVTRIQVLSRQLTPSL